MLDFELFYIIGIIIMLFPRVLEVQSHVYCLHSLYFVKSSTSIHPSLQRSQFQIVMLTYLTHIGAAHLVICKAVSDECLAFLCDCRFGWEVHFRGM